MWLIEDGPGITVKTPQAPTMKQAFYITNKKNVTNMILKCPYDQIVGIPFFTFSYTVRLPRISCQISIYYEV